MAPSQLKRLKHSLREQGLVGAQKSKKHKNNVSRNGNSNESYKQRQGALQDIRDRLNPFDVKLVEKTKFHVTSTKGPDQPAVHRPGVTKGFGEENRRKTLYVEMQRRKKIGGIADRRFGEDDPDMTPEQKALHRFVKERERGTHKNAIFDLEDPDDGGYLTHLGRSLSQDARYKAPDDANDIELSDPEEDALDEVTDSRPPKRIRLSTSDNSENKTNQDGEHKERPKTKKEVMEEVIAKSKLQKYERQKAKEDDDNLRAELDEGLSDLFSALRGNKYAKSIPEQPKDKNALVNPDRLAIIEGKDRLQADKEYDERLRQMVIDQRARPTVPTLTEEERLEKEAQKTRDLEERRLGRMRGRSKSNYDDEDLQENQLTDGDEQSEIDKADAFGLGSGLASDMPPDDLGVEDEDQFLMDEDLGSIATDAESDIVDDRSSSVSGSNSVEDEFVADVHPGHPPGDLKATRMSGGPQVESKSHKAGTSTHTCPATLENLLDITEGVALDDLPIMVQRVRAMYHPKLASENKAKMAVFAGVLVDYVCYLANQPRQPSFTVLEALIRHVHSLAKMYHVEVGQAFRSRLKTIQERRSDSYDAGDLIMLTAIGSIFPTSDHFHQVVTPAMLCMTRYLSQNIPTKLNDLVIGTFICTLCLQYQTFAKRYVPEVCNYVLQAFCALLTKNKDHFPGSIPHPSCSEAFRLRKKHGTADTSRTALTFLDTVQSSAADEEREDLKRALLCTQLRLIQTMTDLWGSKLAFSEIATPVLQLLALLDRKPHIDYVPRNIREQAQATAQTLRLSLQQSLRDRRPLQLHHHRPLPIKTSVPRFDDSFNPEKHNDPNEERAELSKLKAQHKRERKGALRELRKDTRFMAREDLKEKKERDAAYEKRFKRLVAEIQGEEGHEAKVYDKEKKLRKDKR